VLSSPSGSIHVVEDCALQEKIMAERKIYITEHDMERLEAYIEYAEQFGGLNRKDFLSLAEELERAEVVSPEDVPPNVVTMNSKVILCDLITSEEKTYVLVFPKDADINAGAVSVLAPVGLAILGCSKGDVVEWQVPNGKRRFKIKEILYQPEAAGDYHL
jgi:regulator of nucleoside diphosphate kinase